jgi:membrane glycosyltransferase
MDKENKAGENLDNKNQSEEVVLTPEEEAEQAELEEFINEFTEDDYEDAEKVEKLKAAHKQLKTTIAQKNHYRDKYKESVKKPEDKKPEDKKSDAAPAENKSKFDKADILEFQIDQKIPKEVARTVASFAEANGLTLEQAIEHDVMKPYVKAKVDSIEVDQATVPPRNRGGSKLPEKDWSKASNADIVAQRQKIMRAGR